MAHTLHLQAAQNGFQFSFKTTEEPATDLHKHFSNSNIYSLCIYCLKSYVYLFDAPKTICVVCWYVFINKIMFNFKLTLIHSATFRFYRQITVYTIRNIINQTLNRISRNVKLAGRGGQKPFEGERKSSCLMLEGCTTQVVFATGVADQLSIHANY